MTVPADAWCILRMSEGATLPVMDALCADGFDVWTPEETQQRRVGLARKRVSRRAPLLPGFVFARYDRLRELVDLARTPAQAFRAWDAEQRCMVTKGRPYFSVFRVGASYPAVSDGALDALRVAERKGRPLKSVHMFRAGERVKCPDAGFDGLTGIVETTRGRHAIVLFDGFAIPVAVPATSLLAVA